MGLIPGNSFERVTSVASGQAISTDLAAFLLNPYKHSYETERRLPDC
jgi:hypothetical protein